MKYIWEEPVNLFERKPLIIENINFMKKEKKPIISLEEHRLRMYPTMDAVKQIDTNYTFKLWDKAKKLGVEEGTEEYSKLTSEIEVEKEEYCNYFKKAKSSLGDCIEWLRKAEELFNSK